MNWHVMFKNKVNTIPTWIPQLKSIWKLGVIVWVKSAEDVLALENQRTQKMWTKWHMEMWAFNYKVSKHDFSSPPQKKTKFFSYQRCLLSSSPRIRSLCRLKFALLSQIYFQENAKNVWWWQPAINTFYMSLQCYIIFKLWTKITCTKYTIYNDLLRNMIPVFNI